MGDDPCVMCHARWSMVSIRPLRFGARRSMSLTSDAAESVLAALAVLRTRYALFARSELRATLLARHSSPPSRFLAALTARSKRSTPDGRRLHARAVRLSPGRLLPRLD